MKLPRLSLFRSRVVSILKDPVHPLESNKTPSFVTYAHRDFHFHILCPGKRGEPRESNDTPREDAFCRVALGVRLSDFAIFAAPYGSDEPKR